MMPEKLDYQSPPVHRRKPAPAVLQGFLYLVCLSMWLGGLGLMFVGCVLVALSFSSFSQGEQIGLSFALMIFATGGVLYVGSHVLAMFIESIF